MWPTLALAQAVPAGLSFPLASSLLRGKSPEGLPMASALQVSFPYDMMSWVRSVGAPLGKTQRQAWGVEWGRSIPCGPRCLIAVHFHCGGLCMAPGLTLTLCSHFPSLGIIFSDGRWNCQGS